jgi:hypothetical protein
MEKNMVAQDVWDRAREWVNENHPEVDGAEWDRLVGEVATDILAIDELADSTL